MTSRPSPRSFLAVCVALLVAAAGGAASAAAPASAAPLRGIQIAKVGEGDPVGDIARAKALGAQLVRVEILWNRLEPDAAGAPDPAFLAQADDVVRAAQKARIKVLLTVDGTPCWASAAPADVRGDCTTAPQRTLAARYPPADPRQFARVGAVLDGRYAAALAAFEVWNEPDQANELYFAGPDKVQRYAALLKAAYPALKKAAPKVPVLGGSFVGFNGVFLKALYKQGIKGSYDGLSVHFYDLVLNSLRSIRQVQNANHDPAPMWLAEFGWSSCAPATSQDGQYCFTRQAQAKDIRDVYAAIRGTSYLKAAVLYGMSDNDQYDFGVFDAAGRLKPAYAALKAVWAQPRLKPHPVVLKLARRAGRVVATGSGPAGDVMELDVFAGRRLRFQAVFRLARDNTFSLRLPAAASAKGLVVRVFQRWTGIEAQRRITG